MSGSQTSATVNMSANLDISGVLSQIKTMQSAFGELKINPNLAGEITKEFGNLQKLLGDYRKAMDKPVTSKKDLKNLEALEKAINSSFSTLTKLYGEINGKTILTKVDSSQLDELKVKTREAQKALQDAFNNIKIGNSSGGLTEVETAIEKAVARSKTLKNSFIEIFSGLSKNGDIQQFNNSLDSLFNNLNSKLKAGKLQPTIDSLLNSFKSLGLIKIDTPLDSTAQKLLALKNGFETLKTAVANGLNGDELKVLIGNLDKATESERKFREEAEKRGQENYSKQADGLNRVANEAKRAGQEIRNFKQQTLDTTTQLEQLQQSTQYFFSLRNMINLLKRGVREAVQTVKELDAAMTETAVVTKFDVSDMWEKLPEYTANANALGATVQDMYESTTLYYQQGLNAEQTMGIAAETMKMARIGGLEAAEATDMMTAALRGFNMELNETSAQRINDVYSNLAAKTASNTEELGTAMQRTASIAASAGMSFEGTTAFLAQAIETTREPAENLGTAMKTIIARFQELKKNPLEMTEVDGEAVDYNKVDTALKTIGVDLKDTNGQFRDLDQVFLDISQRWDSLTQTQQRYIATTAAGSRQQSRFIAMMSNYDRTMQLMGYANDAEGASNKQFGKTLESLEAKLNKFQNAWKQFLMGIMNDSWTKGIVDGMTTVLNTVNNLINTLSMGSKGIKSALSVFTAFTALKVAGRGANALIGGLGGMIDPQSTARAGMRAGAIGRHSAQAFNQPIVKELQSIRSLLAQKIDSSNLGKNQTTGPYDEYNKFKSARAAMADINNKGQGTIEDLKKQLSGLSSSNQNLLMRGNAGTFRAATDAIINQYGSKMGSSFDRTAIRRGERFLNNQRRSAEITAEEYYTALQDPSLLKRAMLKAGVQKDNAAYQYMEGIDKAVTERASQLANEAQAKALRNVNAAVKKQYGDDPEQYARKLEEAAAKVNEHFKDDKVQDFYRRKALKKEGVPTSSETSFNVSKFGKFLNGVGNLGTGISQAGMGIQAFGSILVGSANPAIAMFGSLLTSTGGLISGIGMGVAGLAKGFTALAESTLLETVVSKVLTAVKGQEAAASALAAGATTAVAAGLLGLVAIIGIAIMAHKKWVEHVKKDAEEVTKNYQDKSQEHQTNLANLSQWKNELAVLSKGVDKNGLNVSLDTSDYQHYLEIVDTIAKINPEIVQGYNSQGHAIIDANTALEKTLDLEKERAEQVLKTYTSDESINKVLKARNLERSHQAGGGVGEAYVETMPVELKPRTNMRQEISKIGDELRRNKDFIDLSKLNIDIDLLAAGDEGEFRKVLDNYNTFKQLVSNSIETAGDEWSEKSQEAISKSLSAYEEYSDELDELVQPTYDILSAKASQTAGFKQMEDGLKAPFQKALKTLATDAEFSSGKEIGEAAKNMATKFASYNDIYLDAMDEVERANKQFALDLNETEYQVNTKDAITQLENLKTTLEDTPEGHAIADWVDNEIAKIENHISGGAKTIEEAWDTISGKVAAAESTLDDFNKSTESDYSTAADNMQKIYDTVMDSDAYHTYGLGDQTFWEGAEKLLGSENIMDKSKDEVYDMMKKVQPFLKEGPDGVKNFAEKVKGLRTELDGIKGVEMDEDGWFASIDENVNPEVWSQIATQLGISEELLTSMLNKARQFKSMDFTDIEAVRAAYSADETVIHGTKQVDVKQTDENGEEKVVQAEKLYITDSELRSRMGTDYYNKQAREDKVEQLESQGIGVLPEHLKELSAAEMESDMGIRNMTDAIETFGQTGTIAKEEIYDAARTAEEARLGDKFDEDAFNQQFGEEWASFAENMEYPTLQPLQSIESLVATIANSVANKAVSEGTLTNRRSDEIEKAVYGEKGKVDSLANYFALGKDAQGQKFNAYTYNKNLGELEDLRSGTQSYLKSLQEGRNKATGEDQARYDDEIAKVTKSLSDLDAAIESGKQKWQEFNNEEGSTSSEEQTNAPDTTSGSYTQEEAEFYSRNTSKIKEFWDNFWQGSTPEGSTTNTDTTDSGLSRKDGGEGYQTNTSSTDTGSASIIESATTASNTINESGQSLSTAATELNTSATQLGTAATNLTAAAITLGQSGQSNQPQGEQPQGPPAPSATVTNNAASLTLDAASATQTLTELNALVDTVKSNINEGATFAINVEDSGLKDAGKNAAAITKAASGNNNIQVSAGEVDLSSINDAKQAIANDKAELPIKAKNDTAEGLAAIKDKISRQSATLKVKAQASGSTNFTVTVSGGGSGDSATTSASGRNNHGIYAPPTFGSAARGKYGQIGPKGKGGLTLTGELGYEIAWIPSENRSVILGANGPQMLNLPGDAVIWDHEQSKQILKQKAIPAGSQSTTKVTSSGPWVFGKIGSGNNGGNGGNGGNGKGKDNNNKGNNGNNKVEKIFKDIGEKLYKVTVWWENIARDTQDTQRRMDKAAKDFEKYTKEMQATLKKTGESVKSGGGGGNDYIQSIKDYQNLNQQQLDRANLELRALEASGLNPKAKNKQLKKEYKKGNVAVEEISYKKGKKSKTKYVDLSKYIKNGQVDEAALKAIKNSSERKAVAEAASKALNDERSKRNSAEDAIEKAKEALDKFGEELYETFHKWEIELTKIWNITQKIERAQARVTRNEGFTDLFGIQLESGFRELGKDTYNLDISLFKDKLTSQTDLLYQRQDLITESRKELTRFLNSEDDKKALEEVRKKIASGTLDATQLLDYTAYEKNLSNDIKVAETAKKLSTITRTGDGTIKIDFDTEALEQARLNGDMTGDFAKAVQEWVKKAQELSNDISKNIESLTSDQAKFYNILRDLQKQISDYAQQLVDMGEQNERKRIDQIRKLSDSLKKAMDKLLKEVKQKLDERRKQEDNVKTERDISQKQQRLAMLRADTSGGHQVEIAQLEKEIAEAQQNYQRSLEDQLIDKLQQQSDIAVEQRERQIELQEALVSTANNIDQVNKWLASEETIRANKDNIIQRYLDSKDYENQPIKTQEELVREANKFYEDILTNQSKQKAAMDNIASIESTLVELDRFLRIQNSTLETAKENGLTVAETQVNFGASAKELKDKAGYTAQEFVNSNLTKLLGEAGFSVKEAQEAGITGVENLLNAGYSAANIAKAGYKANDFFDAAVGYSTVKTAFNRNDLLNSNYRPWVEEEMAYEAAEAARKRQEEAERIARQQEEQQRKQQQLSNYQTAYKNNKDRSWISWASDGSYADKYYMFLLNRGNKYDTGDKNWGKLGADGFKNMVSWGAQLGFSVAKVAKDLADTNKLTWKDVIRAAKKAGYTKSQVSTWSNTDNFKNALSQWSKYKTGGLADYTGPAWLDGTPSKPELVLNSTDTKNFIALKDVLSKAMGSTNAIENTYGGDTTFEININVDHLNNDYDVDKVAERVKKIIVKDSSYRNVTQVRNFR